MKSSNYIHLWGRTFHCGEYSDWWDCPNMAHKTDMHIILIQLVRLRLTWVLFIRKSPHQYRSYP